MRKTGLVIVAVLLCAFVLQGCGGEKVKTTGVPDPVAKVNGEPVGSSLYVQELSRQYGGAVLRDLIEQQIMIQWAKDLKAPVTDEEVQKQKDALKTAGDYEEAVKQVGEDGLAAQMRLRQAQANIAKKLYKIGDKELREVYDNPQAKPRYSHGPQKQIALVLGPDKKKIDDAAAKLKSGADVDAVATEVTGAPNASKVWLDPKQQGVPPALASALDKTGKDKVSPVVALGQSPYQQYAVFKVVATRGAKTISFAQAKPELMIFAASQAIQMHPDFQKKLDARKKAAKIEIEIPRFKGVANQIKNPQPSPLGLGGPMPAR